ncbi:SigE family RNA polymerase sigma factor [Nocardioides sp.]|uniref:SigE family RNA polymerase sigma factor n=1 Tax=Nocardioides sp. TaxID=35761 RepID=UPI0035661457
MQDFEEWVQARSRSLARSAYLLTGDVHLAEDLVQDTLARVADHWSRVSRRGDPDAYARRVMHHRAIDTWRRRSVRPAEVMGDSHPELGQHGPDVERRLVLRQALLRLTPKQRAVLSLRFYDDLTEVQTAGVLGCSPNTVKSQTRQALERLRVLAPDLLSDLVEEPIR